MKTSAINATAVELFSEIKDKPFAFLLDSALVDGKLGKWSFLGADPFLVFKSKKDKIGLIWKDGRREDFKANPFSVLKDLFARFKVPKGRGAAPLASGGVGYFSYDLKDFVEDLPCIASDDLKAPDCVMGFYDFITAIDNWREGACPGSHTARTDARRPDAKKKIRSNFTKASYEKAVLRAKEYIRKGDIYQVNLSQRFETEFRGDAFELYLKLRQESPAPFSSYLNFGDVAVLSSSPERFLKIDGDYIETRPIKGTRPRGKGIAEDAALAKELLGSPKDRAEHVMIVDLERNDLGRVCEYGTVRPSEFVILESYSTVHHLVSTVCGRPRDNATAIDCLMAAFPGGSITGAPKIRSMEIIEELEPVKRGIYTGAIGYIDFSGNMDTSIVIRTFIIKDGKAYFQVGGGIVADSDPEAEYQETLDKAQALISSLGGA